MIPSTLFAVLAAFSSLVAVNGAVVQRDGTFTFMSPQVTSPTSVSTTPTTTATVSTTSTSTAKTTPTTTATTPTTTPTTSTVSTTPTTTPTTVSTTPTTTKTTPTTTSTTPTVTPTTTSTSVPVTTTASTTPTKTSSVTVPVTTSATQCPVTVTSSNTCPPATTTSSTASRTKTATATMSTATGGPGTVSCDSAQQWQAAFAYTAGNQVIFNSQLFTARQWTFNNSPPAHPDQWTLAGTCAQPINNKANCSGVSAWQSTTAYNAGSTVTFNGRLWRAVQWSESNSPGDASGSWQDLGVCA